MSDFRGRRLWACGPGVGRCTRYSIGSVVVVRRWRDGSGNETRGFVDAPTIRIIVMVRRNSAPVPSLAQAATPQSARCLVCRSAALSFCSFFVFFPPLQSRTFGVGCVRGGAFGEPAHRGKIRSHTTGCGVCVRVIPALAGEPSGSGGRLAPDEVYPRAGGGTPPGRHSGRLPPGLSPRRRGNPAVGATACVGIGSIPAQAGEPEAAARAVRVTGVYPRAGGGTSSVARLRRPSEGLSPRRRGNPTRRDHRRGHPGSIPAQAGEPLVANSLNCLQCQRT